MSVGYPDYVRRVQQAGIPIIDVNQVVGAAPYNGTRQFVAGYNWLDLFIDTSFLTNHYYIQLFFYDDPVTTKIIAQPFWIFDAGILNNISIPVAGQWVRIYAAAYEGTDVNPLVIHVRSNPVRHLPADVYSGGVALMYVNQSVAAAATFDTPTAGTHPGPATWALHHGTDNTWTASLQFWDFVSGTWKTFISVEGSDYGKSILQKVTLPTNPVRMEMTNNSAGNRTFIGSLITGA